MPGYNHYPSCPCGWCVKGRMGLSQRYAFEQSFRYRDAELLLQRHHVRSRIACYVNPNARCPICDEPVFFYANAAGSRVYFDDLGPPWPKHPCTDRGAMPKTTARIQRRSGGLTQELVNAANLIGMFNQTAGQKATSAFAPILILEVTHGLTSTTIRGEHIGGQSHRSFTANAAGPGLPLKPGDIVGEQDGIISYVDAITLTPMQFRNGGVPEPYQNPQAAAGLAPPVEARATQAVLIKRRNMGLRKPSKPEPSGDLTVDEVRHFGNDEETIGRLLSVYTPLIRRYAREQTRKPKDVCHRLNREGYTTMTGEAWTHRLVCFLLKLLFNDETHSSVRSKIATERAAGIPKPPIANRVQPAKQPDTADMLATKLGRLGRVTVGKPRNP